MEKRIVMFIFFVVFGCIISGCGGGGGGGVAPLPNSSQISGTQSPGGFAIDDQPATGQNNDPVQSKNEMPASPLDNADAVKMAQVISAPPEAKPDVVGTADNQFVAVFNGSTGCLELWGTAPVCIK